MTEVHASSCVVHTPILDNGPELVAIVNGSGREQPASDRL